MSAQNFLMNNYKKSMTANMKELNRLAEGDLEMQQLLLNAANNFVDERKKIVDSGSSLHEQAQTKKRRTSGASAAAAAAHRASSAVSHLEGGGEERRHFTMKCEIPIYIRLITCSRKALMRTDQRKQAMRSRLWKC